MDKTQGTQKSKYNQGYRKANTTLYTAWCLGIYTLFTLIVSIKKHLLT